MAKIGRPPMPTGMTRREQVEALRAQGMTRDAARAYAREMEQKLGFRQSAQEIAAGFGNTQSEARQRSMAKSHYGMIMAEVERLVPGIEDLSEAAVAGSGRYRGALRRNYKRIIDARDSKQAEYDQLKSEMPYFHGDLREWAKNRLLEIKREEELLNEAVILLHGGKTANIKNTAGYDKLQAIIQENLGK